MFGLRKPGNEAPVSGRSQIGRLGLIYLAFGPGVNFKHLATFAGGPGPGRTGRLPAGPSHGRLLTNCALVVGTTGAVLQTKKNNGALGGQWPMKGLGELNINGYSTCQLPL